MANNEVNAPNYTQWENHFKNMALGKLDSSKKVIVVSKDQIGSGATIQLVSPAQQVDAMAKGKVERTIKRKASGQTLHSVQRQARGKNIKRRR